MRWEDGDMKGIVLNVLVNYNSHVKFRERWDREEDRQRRTGQRTFLPMTPRQAIEGMVVIIELMRFFTVYLSI